jgi:Domain of unknown function (DUF4177)
MSERKHTPDVLAAILNGEAPVQADFDAAALARATPPPRVKSQPRRPAPEGSAKAEKPAQAAKPRPSTVTHWVYQVISLQDNHGWRVRFIDGQEVKNWAEAATLGEILTQRGEEGWELVSSCSGEAMFGHSDKYQLFFKRAAA